MKRYLKLYEKLYRRRSKLYDEDGRYVGDLIEEEDDSIGKAFVGVIILLGLLSAFLSRYFANWFGERGFYCFVIFACSVMVFLWFRFTLPYIRNDAAIDSKFWDIVVSVFVSILVIAFMTFIFFMLADLFTDSVSVV